MPFYIVHASWMYLQFMVCLSLNQQKDYEFQIIEAVSFEFELAIFENCFPGNSQPVVTIRNWNMGESRILSQWPSKLVYLVGIDKEDNLEAYQVKMKRHLTETNDILPVPATKFVIEVVKTINLELILYKLKHSSWWNIHGFFLIKNVYALNSCQSAYLFLNMIWKFNILNGIYICHHPNDEIGLYIFSPYRTEVSKYWKKVGVYTQKNGHPFSIFMFIYQQKENVSLMCEALKFDKTQDLSNYPIKIADMFTNMSVTDYHGKIIKVNPFETVRGVQKIVWERMAANTNYTFSLLSELGTIDKNGVASRKVGEILRGEYESCGIDDFQRGLWRNEANFFRITGICFIIRKESTSITERFLKLFPPRIRIALLILFISVMVLLTYLLRMSCVEVALNVVRIAIGVSTIHEPNAKLSRLIFIWVIFAFMIVNTYLQSQLSALITTASKHNDSVKSAEDLVANNYNVCGPAYYQQFYRQTVLRDLITPVVNLMSCIELMKVHVKTACVGDCMVFRHFVKENDEFHVTTDKEFDRYNVIIFQDDSPLLKRFEMVCLKILQHGLLNYLISIEKLAYKSLRSDGFQPISIFSLQYSFNFLAVLYSLASLIFIIELAVACSFAR